MQHEPLPPEAMQALMDDIKAATTDAERIVLMIQYLDAVTGDIYATDTAQVPDP